MVRQALKLVKTSTVGVIFLGMILGIPQANAD